MEKHQEAAKKFDSISQELALKADELVAEHAEAQEEMESTLSVERLRFMMHKMKDTNVFLRNLESQVKADLETRIRREMIQE